MKATSLRQWFIRNDLQFGLTLVKMEPEDAARAICDKYGFDFSKLSPDDTEGVALLEMLNNLEGE